MAFEIERKFLVNGDGWRGLMVIRGGPSLRDGPLERDPPDRLIS
jgi:hypothetical protein